MSKNEEGCEARQCHERLLTLASAYRNLSRRELARELRRDASNLVRANGNPKLDYLNRLASVLDWPIGMVAEALLDEDRMGNRREAEAPFAALDKAALQAHGVGEYDRMYKIARRMQEVSTTADEAALATLRAAGGLDGLGRYARQVEVLQRGIARGCDDISLMRLLQANLANVHYMVWNLFEARGMARELIDGFDACSDEGRRARACYAYAHYVYGNACRRLLIRRADAVKHVAEMSRTALRRARDLYTDLADEFDHDSWRGIARTCDGGILEVEVEMGERSAKDVVAEITSHVDAAVDRQEAGDRLESLGWWCIFGGNVASRHLDGRAMQCAMAHFIKCGYDVAERLGNWAMRERLFTLDLLRRRELNDLAGEPVEWVIDVEGIRDVVGTMGRFPSFRGTGWQILRVATAIERKAV